MKNHAFECRQLAALSIAVRTLCADPITRPSRMRAHAPLRVPVRACLRARESERGKTVTAHAFRFRKLRAKVSAKPRAIQSAKWSSQDIARFGQKITTARQR